jgi:hypothetical protein
LNDDVRRADRCAYQRQPRPIVNDLIQAGALVAPFKNTIVGSRAYFLIESPAASGKPHVHRFVEWLLDEIKRESEREEQR